MTSNAELVAASAAEAAGVKLTENGRANVLAMLDTFGTMRPNEPVTIELEGEQKNVADWIAGLVTECPSYFQKLEPDPATASSDAPAGENMTARAIRLNALARSTGDSAKIATAEAIVNAHGNPYVTKNLTHRMYIEKNAPDFAAKLRAKAGIYA